MEAVVHDFTAQIQAGDLEEIRAAITTFTTLEAAVVKLSMNGRLNKQIAAELACDLRTVEHARQRVRRKLGCETWNQVMVDVTRAGLEV